MNPAVRVAYGVISHREPQQVLRLVRALREGPASQVAVRHDPRGPRLGADEIRAAGALPLEDDIVFEWGGFTQLELLLSVVKRLVRELDPDWVLILSGQDYPVRPLSEVEAFLAETEHDALLGDAWEVPADHLPGPPQDEFFQRYLYRHRSVPKRTPSPPGALRPLAYLRRNPGGMQPQLGLRALRTPFDESFRPFVSADWVTLGRRALAAIERASGDRGLLDYYRRVAVPSEGFFATVLLNDPELSVASHNRRYVHFESHRTPHPKTLGVADLPAIEATDALFARKFDPGVDARVLDVLDERRGTAKPR